MLGERNPIMCMGIFRNSQMIVPGRAESGDLLDGRWPFVREARRSSAMLILIRTFDLSDRRICDPLSVAGGEMRECRIVRLHCCAGWR